MPKKINTDQQLIQMLGSEHSETQNAAVKEIYQLYYRPVAKSLKNKNLAKELFPEAVLALQKIILEGKLNKPNILPYLLGVCHFSRNKRYRDQPIAPSLEKIKLSELLSAPEVSLLEELDKEKYVAGFLKEAEKKHSRCIKHLKLRFFEYKNHTEIAQDLGFKNANNSKTELYRCLKRIRSFLEVRPKWQKIFRELLEY